MRRMLCDDAHCAMSIVQRMPAAIIAGLISLIVLYFYGQAADWNYQAAVALMSKYKPPDMAFELEIIKKFRPEHWLTLGGAVVCVNAFINSVVMRHRRYFLLLLSSFGLPGTMLSAMWIATALAWGRW